MSDTGVRPTRGAVQGNLDELQAERNATWSEERLIAHAALRRSLEDRADRAGFIAVGDALPSFVLDEVDGGIVASAQLLRRGPLVLLFFRFEGCPACNAALRGYQATLAGPLADLGAELVAISAQVPHVLRAIKERHGLTFSVASDPGAQLIGELGIGFAPDEEGRRASLAAGNDLGATLGTGDWTLPYPTVIVADADGDGGGIVRFVDVHPDWMVRTEAATVIDQVRLLVARTDL